MPVLKIKQDGVWKQIAGGGGAVDLDTTLTQEGMAADAKAVGDALNSMATVIAVDDGEGNIELNPFLTNGALISEILTGEY